MSWGRHGNRGRSHRRLGSAEERHAAEGPRSVVEQVEAALKTPCVVHGAARGAGCTPGRTDVCTARIDFAAASPGERAWQVAEMLKPAASAVPAPTPAARSGTRWDGINAARAANTHALRLNLTEQRFTALLEEWREAGEILRYEAHALRLLAERSIHTSPDGKSRKVDAIYTPDFVVWRAVGAPLELWEVKGRRGWSLNPHSKLAWQAAAARWHGTFIFRAAVYLSAQERRDRGSAWDLTTWGPA